MSATLERLAELTGRLNDRDVMMAAFVEQAPFCMWMKDYQTADGRMVFISDKYEEIFGLKAEDYVGKTDKEVWPATVAAMFRKQDMEVMRTGKDVWKYEPTPMSKDPRWNYCMTLKFPIKNQTGIVIGVGGIAWPAYGTD